MQLDFYKNQLNHLREAHLLRRLRCAGSAQGPIINIDGKDCIIFCSNNYLNLAEHPSVRAAAKKAIDEFGFGSAASRLISGTMPLHVELEKAFAKFLKKDSALLFPSGWTANEAILKTIPQKHDIVLLDRADHASIIDAAQGCQADFRTYHRDDLSRLEKYLSDKSHNRKFIVTESVFSMDGDVADLAKLVELKNKYGAFLIVDEAHSVGCMGPSGAGLAEHLGLLSEIDMLVATLGKAFGSAGAVVAADSLLIEYMVNKARPFIYTTAPPSSGCAAAIEALRIIKAEPRRRLRLAENADYLRENLNRIGLVTANSRTHIIPVILKTPEKALEVSRRLFEQGFFVAAIRPPTVPAGTARLRISLQADHTKEQMDALTEAMTRIKV